MSPDVVLILKSVFRDIWSLFVSWRIPGTSITPAAWGVFSVAVILVFRFVRVYFLGEDGDQ